MQQLTSETLGEEVLSALDDSLQLAYASSGIELQAGAINRLADLDERVTEFWAEARHRGDENGANLAFTLLRFIGGTAKFLRMWMQIKQDEMQSAWDSLIDAQDQIECGLRFLYNPLMVEVAKALLLHEQLLFPPQQFVSSSIVYEFATCTICRGVYGDCGHVKGRLYMGRMCGLHPENISHLAHIAYVNRPYDKGCRVAEIQQSNQMICTLTRRVIEEVEISENGLTAWAIAMRPTPTGGVVRVEKEVRDAGC